MAGDTDGLSLLDARRNSDFDAVSFSLASARIDASQRNGANGAAHRFVECDQNITFDVAAAHWPTLATELFAVEAIFSEWRVEAATASEELFEKVAKPGATEMKFVILGAPRSALAAGLLTGRRVEISAMFPIRAKFIVAFAFLGIAENFVGFVDFFELRFGRFLIFGDVGMILAGEFAEGLFCRGGTRVGRFRLRSDRGEKDPGEWRPLHGGADRNAGRCFLRVRCHG